MPRNVAWVSTSTALTLAARERCCMLPLQWKRSALPSAAMHSRSCVPSGWLITGIGVALSQPVATAMTCGERRGARE